MFIRSILISNFRPFKEGTPFKIENFGIPDNSPGSGLNVFVGENGCGKTALLDALVLPLLAYKAEGISVDDFHSKDSDLKISIYTEKDYAYDGTMPKVVYKGKGFGFDAKIRARESKAYMSSIVVSDQRYIRADGESKPEDGRPDLRIKVDNPWKGARFAENDILYLEKNRAYQIRSGTYNSTRFDRLMEDHNFQYIKENSPVKDLDAAIVKKVLTFENPHLKNALDRFEKIYGEPIRLSLFDNHKPFKSAFFSLAKPNNSQISLPNIGSGFEMIFTLLYSYYLSQQSGKQLILLIDEPELHLHPGLQSDFADILLDFSSDTQIFITTHSPLLIKQLMTSTKPVIKILTKTSDTIEESSPLDKKLSYLSASEVNFIAFQLPSEEYHNELYEELFGLHATTSAIKDFDQTYFQAVKGEVPSYDWKGHPNEVSLHTYVRNQIHHQKSCGKASIADLKTSIETMRSYL